MGEEKSDLSRAFSEDGARKTHVGGQALIEGIMMRPASTMKLLTAITALDKLGGSYQFKTTLKYTDRKSVV